MLLCVCALLALPCSSVHFFGTHLMSFPPLSPSFVARVRCLTKCRFLVHLGWYKRLGATRVSRTCCVRFPSPLSGTRSDMTCKSLSPRLWPGALRTILCYDTRWKQFREAVGVEVGIVWLILRASPCGSLCFAATRQGPEAGLWTEPCSPPEFGEGQPGWKMPRYMLRVGVSTLRSRWGCGGSKLPCIYSSGAWK